MLQKLKGLKQLLLDTKTAVLKAEEGKKGLLIKRQTRRDRDGIQESEDEAQIINTF